MAYNNNAIKSIIINKRIFFFIVFRFYKRGTLRPPFINLTNLKHKLFYSFIPLSGNTVPENKICCYDP